MTTQSNPIAAGIADRVFTENVWLVKSAKIFIDQWGTYITTPAVSESKAKINLKTKIANTYDSGIPITLSTSLLDADGKIVAKKDIRRYNSWRYERPRAVI